MATYQQRVGLVKPATSGRRLRLLGCGLGFVVLGLLLGLWRFFGIQHPAETLVESGPPQNPSQEVVTSNQAREEPSTSGTTALTKAPTDPATTKIIAELLDSARPLKERREQARTLARLGTAQAMSVLRAALQDGPPYLKAGIGESLGESPAGEAMQILLDLVHDADEVAARGAIRGLALRGDADSSEALGKVLFDENMPESVRSEAALALGDVQLPAALAALSQAATEWREGPLAESALEGLGKRPFSETEEFFRDYLQTPGLPAEARIAGIEALANSSGDVAPFLLGLAGDSDPEVRAAAAWALVGAGGDSDISASLVTLLRQEPDSTVRARLYQALGTQETLDASAMLALAQKETAPDARLEALAMLATACHSTPSNDSLAYFNQTAVPELKQTALNDQSSQNRLSSVTALARAGTAESTAALTEIARQAADPRVVEAAQAGLRHGPNNFSSL
jgi:HEAT repeat protein